MDLSITISWQQSEFHPPWMSLSPKSIHLDTVDFLLFKPWGRLIDWTMEIFKGNLRCFGTISFFSTKLGNQKSRSKSESLMFLLCNAAKKVTSRTCGKFSSCCVSFLQGVCWRKERLPAKPSSCLIPYMLFSDAFLSSGKVTIYILQYMYVFTYIQCINR